MFEFRWILPSAAGPHELVLEVHARNSWFGRKVLRLDGRILYHRGRTDGIDHTFRTPDAPGRDARLQLVPAADAGGWTPRLTIDGTVATETTNTIPPRIVKAPPLIATVTGLVYLMMLMVVVSLPPIVKILYALYGPGKPYAIPGYEAGQHINGWIVPFLGTAVCLLGFWNMRRWGVLSLAALIVVEVAACFVFHALPLSPVALGIQALLLLVGAAHYRGMH